MLRVRSIALRTVLNRRKIWVSLKIGYQNKARKRASLLHARTLDLFMHAHSVLAEPDALSRTAGFTAGFAERDSAFICSGNKVGVGVNTNQPNYPKLNLLCCRALLKRFVLDS